MTKIIMIRITPVNLTMVLDDYVVPLQLNDPKVLMNELNNIIMPQIDQMEHMEKRYIIMRVQEKLEPRKLFMRTVALLIDDIEGKPEEYALAISPEVVPVDKFTMPQMIRYSNGALFQSASNEEGGIMIAEGYTEVHFDVLDTIPPRNSFSKILKTTVLISKKEADELSGKILLVTESQKVLWDISIWRRIDYTFSPLRKDTFARFSHADEAFKNLSKNFSIYFDDDFLKYTIQKLTEWHYIK